MCKKSKQVSFKVSDELAERVRAVCETLGVDVANLCRLILIEGLPQYELKAESCRKEQEAAKR